MSNCFFLYKRKPPLGNFPCIFWNSDVKELRYGLRSSRSCFVSEPRSKLRRRRQCLNQTSSVNAWKQGSQFPLILECGRLLTSYLHTCEFKGELQHMVAHVLSFSFVEYCCISLLFLLYFVFSVFFWIFECNKKCVFYTYLTKCILLLNQPLSSYYFNLNFLMHSNLMYS